MSDCAGRRDDGEAGDEEGALMSSASAAVADARDVGSEDAGEGGWWGGGGCRCERAAGGLSVVALRRVRRAGMERAEVLCAVRTV
jgi:hypothetical protein